MPDRDLLPRSLAKRLATITTVILDVDGVMTDGGIYLGPDGVEIKRFDVHDGSGIVYLHRAGFSVVIISGRSAVATEARARELDIEDVYQGYKRKMDAFDAFLHKRGRRAEEICCVGDDLPDIPLLRAAGVGIAVANARPEVKEIADYVTLAPGGRGAVREVAEFVIKAQGKWNLILQPYFVEREA